jgi:phosphonatase-like hydrolase
MAGTVVSDGGIVMNSFAAAMAAVGVEGDALATALEYARQTMGLPKKVVFTALLDAGGLLERAGLSGAGGHGDSGRVHKAVDVFGSSILAAIGDGKVAEVPGARAAMEALRSEGAKICLTTGFPAEIQELIVAYLGWEGAVDLLMAPAEGVRGRPFPDMVLTATVRLAIDDVRQVAVVGDTANDLWSGYRAGAGVVAGVLTGTHGREELEAAPHTHILGSVADLPPLVANWAPELLATPGDFGRAYR